jgi:hypothetical protein
MLGTSIRCSFNLASPVLVYWLINLDFSGTGTTDWVILTFLQLCPFPFVNCMQCIKIWEENFKLTTGLSD